MSDRLNNIANHIASQDGVTVQVAFSGDNNDIITGDIELTESGVTLPFKVVIYPYYPQQAHDMETIKFFNDQLIEFDHVNRDGSICVHTQHSPDLRKKIDLDINSLRHWVRRYYINKEKDKNYEHIVTPQNGFNDEHPFFLFTNVDHTFKNGDFGYFEYSALATGIVRKDKAVTYLVQNFIVGKKPVNCTWSGHYTSLSKTDGIYYYSEKPPVEKRRFGITNWQDLDTFFSQPFFSFLQEIKKTYTGKQDHSRGIPLMIGYPINDGEIHWQVIMIPSDNFPNYGQKVFGSTSYIGRMVDMTISWGQTRNCSYKYFFGRGAFNAGITKSKILVIGIGAIGSMVATTLVRGGCTDIYMIDHDVKEPENVCRSEYFFNGGVTNKINVLTQVLTSISPHVEVRASDKLMDFAKIVLNIDSWKKPMEEHFSEFDLIFDCSTDNDVAYLFSQLNIRSKIFNFSITNHAAKFVCVVKPVYPWLMKIFDKLENDLTDMYSPTGCWSPTFKASYNDIALWVQFALKHINANYAAGLTERNFYLSFGNNELTEIKLTSF